MDIKCVIFVVFLIVTFAAFTLQGDVTNFEIEVGGTNLVSVESGSSSTVNLVYNSDTTTLTFSAQLDTGTSLDTNGANIDTTAKTVAYPISSSFITDGFGTYLVTFTLTPTPGNSGTKEIVIFYEEAITGFSITRDSSLPLDENVFFDVSLTTGSNIETEWFLDNNDTCLFKHAGQPRSLSLNFTFTVPGTHNVTAIAANTVSRTFDSMIIYANYKLNGFNITVPEGPTATNILVYFKVKLDTAANQPMGTLRLNATYGDGSIDSIELDSHVATMQAGSGYEVSHAYTTQGNYTAVFAVYSEIDTQDFNLDVYIWDPLSVTMESENKTDVGSQITFTFMTPPNSGFQYSITYGDGNTRENSVSDLYIPYNFATWTHTYTSPGEYNVTLVAYNPFYASICSYMIEVLYAIPDENITLTPTTDEIPIPDGTISFTLELIVDMPYSIAVTCSFDFGEVGNQETDVASVIEYGNPIQKNITYNSAGTKQVTITCSNAISTLTRTATITVRDFTLSDFDVIYPNPVNMNMTLDSTKRVPYISPGSVDIPVVTSFYVTLFACSKFPPNISVAWNFGDGSSVESGILTTPQQDHEFTERGTYTVELTFTNISDNSQTTKSYAVTLGIIDFGVSPMAGAVGETFTFSATGILGTPTYTFEPDSNDATTTINSESMSIVYQSWGYYTVSVTGTNGTCTEVVYQKTFVAADYSLTGELTLSFSNQTVFLPPGAINLTASIPDNADPKPAVNCSFNSGDKIGITDHSFFGNITADNPLSYEFSYYTLGNHTLTINCSNAISHVQQSINVLARNPCFTDSGIFDRQYSLFMNPMKALTSMALTIASRMGVICNDKTAQFHWSVSTVNGSDFKTEIQFETLTKGAWVFPRGEYKEGMYYVTLNVSLDGTYIMEFIYLQFKKPPPFAFIVGGTKRTARIIDGEIILNALQDSYDSEGGYGANQNLTFSWTCDRLSVQEFDEMEVILAGDTSVVEGDCDLESTDTVGIRQLNVTTGSPAYAGTVSVSDGTNESNFTQLVKVVPGDPPNIVVTCVLNCYAKVIVTARLNVASQCTDCSPSESPNYVWSLSMYDTTRNDYTPVSNFADMTYTDTNKEAMAIKENQLLPGEKYSLKLVVTVDGRAGASESVMDFKTNTAPYGGSCSVTPEKGKAAIDSFDISCTGWLDEGDRDAGEGLLGEILTYTYGTIIQRNNSGVIENENTELYQGSESTLINAPFQVGDPSFDYNVTVLIQIRDEFGASANFYKVIEVAPDSSMVPTSANDTAAINKLFDSFDEQFNVTNAGGNDQAVLRLVTSTASMISGDLTQDDSGTPTEEQILNGEVTDITEEEESPVTKLYKEKTQMMTDIIVQATGADDTNDDSDVMSVSDAQQVSRTLQTVARNTQYLTDDALFNIAKVGDKIMRGVQNKVRARPFPVEDLASINSAIEGTYNVVDKLLKKLLPDELFDLEAEFTEDTVYDQLVEEQVSAGTTIDKTVLRERARLLYSLESRKREAQRQQSQSAEQSVPNMISSIIYSQNTKLSSIEVGEEPSVVKKDGLSIGVQKVTAKDLTNGSVAEMNGFRLEFDSNSTDETEEQLNVTQAVFDKSPYIYGTNAPSVKSKVIQVSISNSSYVPAIRIPNPSPTTFKKYQPLIAVGKELIYIQFSIPNDDDSVMVYLYPENFDPGNVQAIYTLYAKDLSYPLTSDYTFKQSLDQRDWTEYGYRTFIQQSVLRKGDQYLGIKQEEVPDYSQFSGIRARRKRSASLGTTESPTANGTAANFSIIIVTTGCRSWNEATKTWDSNGCQVLAMSTLNDTVCRCPTPSGNTFATTFFVPPNTIDFSTVFSKFDPANAAVYGTLIGLLVVYIIAVILLRRADRRDIEKWKIHFLCDSDSSDTYFYLITVYTGLRRGAGTKSLVNFILAGEDQDTGVRMLSDGVKEGFATGSVRQFLMGTIDPLGDLTYLRIWHDNSGQGNLQSWYLNKITIDDLQTSQRCVFMCDRWFAVERDDGMVERILPVCGKDNLLTFNNLFAQNANFNITENHLWLSLMIRPQRSTFSRVQRLSCLLALLVLTMIANAMFFRSSDQDVTPGQVQLGFISFSLTTVYISFIGILITTPPIILVTFIFKKSKPKPYTPIKNKHILQNLKIKGKDGMTKENMEFKGAEFRTADDFHTTDHLPLPYWTVYIAWVVLAIASVTSAFFLILYSMEWGKPKSEEWLTTFVFSFLESIICVDPLKVIVIAVIFAVLFKKSNDDDAMPTIDLEKVRKASCMQNSGSTRTYLDFWNDVILKNETSNDKKLEEHRRRRQQELKAREAFIQLLLYGIFTFSLFSISYIERDHRMYLMKDSLDNYLVKHYTTGFSAVNGTEDYVTWLKEIFIPAYYPLEQFDGASLSTTDKQYFADLANIRVGPGRLRQVRMNRGKCDYSDLTVNYPCIGRYYATEEDTNNHCLNWTPYNASVCGTTAFKQSMITADAWNFVPATEIWGLPISGEYNTYGGGGYILKFTQNRANALNMVNEVLQYGWIDRGTRAIFLECTLYNPNANLFAYLIFLTEFSEIGGTFTWTITQSFRPILSIGALGTFAIICYVIFVLYLLMTIVKTCLEIKQNGLFNFLKDPWNVIDSICTLLSCTAIVVFGFRISYADKAMQMYYDEKLVGDNRYINFFHIVIWDNIFNIIIAILVFVATLRMLKILGYNKRFTQIASVVTNAAGEICGFSLVFGIIFFAYVSLGYLLFGTTLREYRSLFKTWGSLTNALIGKNSLDSMIRAAPHLAQLFYFTYIFCVILTLLTMFAAILNKSISTVKADMDKTQQTFGIADMLTSSLQDIIGISFSSNKNGGNKDTFIQKKYVPVPGKSVAVDAPNVLRLVRETFGELGEGQVSPNEDNLLNKMKRKEQDVLLDRLPYISDPSSRMDTLSRIDTPGDITFTFDDYDRGTPTVRPSYM